ncbi:MAG: hypothetical protein AAF565_18570 [Pseudomonadota bacterium]
MRSQTRWLSDSSILLLGAGSRLVVAALLIAVLWAGFFWATSTPGAL